MSIGEICVNRSEVQLKIVDKGIMEMQSLLVMTASLSYILNCIIKSICCECSPIYTGCKEQHREYTFDTNYRPISLATSTAERLEGFKEYIQ